MCLCVCVSVCLCICVPVCLCTFIMSMCSVELGREQNTQRGWRRRQNRLGLASYRLGDHTDTNQTKETKDCCHCLLGQIPSDLPKLD